jgi:erythromycin esterase
LVKIVIFILILLTQLLVYGQADLSTYELLKRNTIQLRGLTPADFQFLDSILADKRIVFLGEATHGDGRTIVAKSHMIDFLVSKLGYEVMIFERGFYEMHKMHEWLLKHKHDNSTGTYILKEGFRLGGYVSKSATPLRNSLLKHNSEIVVGGIELTPNDNWFSQLIIKDFSDLGLKRNLVKKYSQFFTQLMIFTSCNCERDQVSFSYSEFEQISNTIITEIKLKGVKKENVEILIQTLISNLNCAKWIANRPIIENKELDRLASIEYNFLRERFLAENLTWHLQANPDKKIIISTSTFHMSKDICELPTMVDYLDESLRSESYFLPFIYYTGTRGIETDLNTFKIDHVQRDSSSLEFLLSTWTNTNGFLDFGRLTTPEKDTINSLSMYPSSMIRTNGKWTDIYSGVFFINEMKPDYWETLSINDSDNIQRVKKAN